MRKDMAEVIIERPRSLGHDAIRRQHKKTGLRIRNYDPDNEYDDLPTHLSSSRHKQYGRAAKYMTDLLTPIYRFLHSNVGRPWDQVWSEVCQQIDRRNLAKNHLFEHFDGIVETNTFIGEDGDVYVCEFDGFRKAKNLGGNGFYVHPTTGLLCWADDRPRNQSRQMAKEAAKKAKQSWYLRITENQYYLKLNGIWYIAVIARFYINLYYRDEMGRWQKRDPEPEPGTVLMPEGEYGPRWRVLSKRQCSKKELRAAGLSNDRPK